MNFFKDRLRLVYIIFLLLILAINFALLIALYSQFNLSMIEWLLIPFVWSFVFSFLMSSKDWQVFIKIIINFFATYAGFLACEILQVKWTSFSNPNAMKWATVGIFLIPIYILPSVLAMSIFLTQIFNQKKQDRLKT